MALERPFLRTTMRKMMQKRNIELEITIKDTLSVVRDLRGKAAEVCGSCVSPVCCLTAS